MAAVVMKCAAVVDELMPPLVMDVLTLDSEERHLSGLAGRINLYWSLLVLATQMMRRPDTLLSEGELLATVFADDVPADGMDRLQQAMKDLTAAVRLLSQERVRIRKELPAGYVMQTRRAATKEGRALRAAQPPRPRGRPRRT